MTNNKNLKVAYFSMEIALENNIKTYSGGLGVLAGDILKSAADLRLEMAGVTLLSREGYFKQKIDEAGNQNEIVDNDYDFSKLKKLPNEIEIKIAEDKVLVGVWEYLIKSPKGFNVPVYFLDTNISANKPVYRALTDKLYGGDKEVRLLQEIILGRAGVKILASLGYSVEKYHINEGHGAFVMIEQFLNSKQGTEEKKIKEVREKCIFTTHTPVKMGHDIFPVSLILKYQKDFPVDLPNLIEKGNLNMTKLALYFSRYINGVAISHSKTASRMFPGYLINAITNGVHSLTWTSPEFQKLYNKYIPGWQSSNLSLRNAATIPLNEIWEAHQEAKKKLFKYLQRETEEILDINTFTIGLARRFTPYKRLTLLFSDMRKLLEINNNIGRIQIVCAGKAHPRDEAGKELIKQLFNLKNKYQKEIKIVFLENYNLDNAKLLVSGVDLWLNTPLPPNEASGTSGMKAAHNGIPQLSTWDGWWREGYIRNKTGWTIRGAEEDKKTKNINERHAESLYKLLGKEILPRYYKSPEDWREIMRFSISINASYFNTERVLNQYIQEAYL